MSIPNYEGFMNATLQAFAENGGLVKRQDLVDRIADIMQLSTEDRSAMMGNGRETIINSRIYWAAYYLYVAGLLAREGQMLKSGAYKITDEGKKLLSLNVDINTNYLLQHYPSVQEWLDKTKENRQVKSNQVKMNLSGNGNTQQNTAITISQDDPETMIDNAIGTINAKLEQDILESVQNASPRRFEFIVIDLMEAMGYGHGTPTQYVGDGGIDGIINEDELGLSKIYLQAKRYASNNKVHDTEMRAFVGALTTKYTGVSKGVFLTTSSFDDKAIKSAEKASNNNCSVVLVDGHKLAQLMRKYNLGARNKKNYDIKELDTSYFEESQD
ncbi:MAG: restriction endonuclease [Alphaproteobacteria bacterium]|nr:restriction endonuclease [Alphaproteobacteria bacterium]